MLESRPTCVITTINPPTQAVKILASKNDVRLIVVGDRKTPVDWEFYGVRFIPFSEQEQLSFSLSKLLPIDHYARKNIGYLQALAEGATVIYDTDDDNAPNDAWGVRQETCRVKIADQTGWCNTYRFFHESEIWPRGFDLKSLGLPYSLSDREESVRCPIQQGLADGEADTDAIWRLAAIPATLRGQPIRFTRTQSVALNSGVVCPFNSQSTWWWAVAHPLLYLPSYSTFRMTDIWRSFVAQRCLWEVGSRVAFHSPAEVYQLRNPHDLLVDFEDEVPGYLNNGRIVESLNRLNLRSGELAVLDNLGSCYEALVTLGVLPVDELRLVSAWIDDFSNLNRK